MARNILIFSDGTGQVGGYEFDEDRTNVYKLFRATRVGPDSCIDPKEQSAFYDPGLGSRGEGGFPLGRLVRWIYRKVSQAIGTSLRVYRQLYCAGLQSHGVSQPKHGQLSVQFAL